MPDLMADVKTQCLLIVLLPLLAAIVAGLLGKRIGKWGASTTCIIAVGLSCLLSIYLLNDSIQNNRAATEIPLYIWGKVGNLQLQLGFLIDRLSLLMMAVVTFVSWMVHIYTVGYMQEDPGYQRFFSYISLFTFGMLILVMSNNFLQLFFGWEMVGLMSYLLIGFWFQKETAIAANLKAFIVNRVGDFGFILGIAGVFYSFGTLDYSGIFSEMGKADSTSISITFICLSLFVGAMAKSAQIPLHVWLPDSMEGPTPISALIHAATMVTAGVFMLARLSPLFEYSETALNVILIIGSLTCLLMGLVGVVQNDIKRIIAYSTLSQLGYMMVAMAVSAYPIGIFHLMTHAFFKALLFLGAGSVILSMHHEQNIWKMGCLRKYMPITYVMMLIGSLALVGFPFFSGFYSKDLIIEAVEHSNLPMASIAYSIVLGSVFITGLYTFRLFFVVFHTQERMAIDIKSHLRESPKIIWVPLLLLAIPSILAGAWFIQPMFQAFFKDSIVMHPDHPAFLILQKEFSGAIPMALHGLESATCWLAFAGIIVAWFCYCRYPQLPDYFRQKYHLIYILLKDKFGFDRLNQWVFVIGTRRLGWFFWHFGDQLLIDGRGVNGSAKSIDRLAYWLRRMQTGYLYHYAFAMISGFLVLLLWLMLTD